MRKKYVIMTICVCLFILIALYAIGYAVGYNNIQGQAYVVFIVVIFLSIGVGWIAIMVSFASIIAKPILKNMSEERMVKLHIPTFFLWREAYEANVKTGKKEKI